MGAPCVVAVGRVRADWPGAGPTPGAAGAGSRFAAGCWLLRSTVCFACLRTDPLRIQVEMNMETHELVIEMKLLERRLTLMGRRQH